jgi:general secretion pathway protein A
MYWMLTPGIETNVAYGLCMLLFGLLVLSVRNRKLATRAPYSFYASSLRNARRPAPITRPVRSSQSSAVKVTRPEPLSNPCFEDVALEPIRRKATENFSNALLAPQEITAATNSSEANMNTPLLPLESGETIAPVKRSAFAATANGLSIQNAAAYGLVESEESNTREIGFVHGSDVTAVPVEDENWEVQARMKELAMFPLEQPVEAPVEKPAPRNLLNFFGLQQQPFDVTPDPAYLYRSASHSEALKSLKQGIEHFRGFIMLVAEPGMGKTTLLNKLMEEVNDSARVVFLFQTQCSSQDLLRYILNELQVDHAGMDVVAMHRALNQALLEEMLRGRRFVLVVDEAQNLQEPVLETIRLLSDFETTHSKLIQIVLAGQPQLAETLMRDSLVQLRQRVAVLANLRPLNPIETAEYIEHRLRSAGWSDKLIFSAEALDMIADASGGVPRSINNLCFNSLLEAYHRGQDFVDSDVVNEVTGRLNLESLVRRPPAGAASSPSAGPSDTAEADQIAGEIAAALSAQASAAVNAPNFIGPKPKPDVVLTGNLTEKVRSQGWSKRHEYRILVTLERDPVTGVPIADRYYCCSIYMDAAQAAALKPGKPVRIKIEQD